jgi:hypothetical protein
VRIREIEKNSNLTECYLKDDTLCLEVKPGTEVRLKEALIEKAGKFYLSAHKELRFVRVHIVENGFPSMVALYENRAE